MARAPAEGAPTSGSYRLPATGPATPVSRMMKLKTMATAMPTTSGRKASWNLCSVGVTPLDAKQRGNADPDVRHPVRIRSCPLEETLESDDPGAAHGDGPEHHGTHRWVLTPTKGVRAQSPGETIALGVCALRVT